MRKFCALLIMSTVFSLFASCHKPPVLETQAPATAFSADTSVPAPTTPAPVQTEMTDTSSSIEPAVETTGYDFPSEFIPTGAEIPDEQMPEPDTASYRLEKYDGPHAFHESAVDALIAGSRPSIFVHTVYYDHCFYRLVDNKQVYKYDLLTDTYGPACVDPGCAHNAMGCISYDLNYPQPLSGHAAQLITADEHYLYFRSGTGIYRYDLTNAKTELFTETLDDLTENVGLIPYGDAFYMTTLKKPKNGTAEFKNMESVIVKIDKKTGKKDVIVNFGTDRGSSIIAIRNGRIYICHNNIEYYSLDLSGSDRQPLMESKWLWQGEVTEDGALIYSNIWQFQSVYYKSCMIHELDPDTGGDTVICGYPVYKYYVTSRYIYYIPRYEKTPKNLPLVRMNHDGSGKEVVWWLHSMDVDNFFVDGDYLLFLSTVLTQTEDGYLGATHFYVCDLTTGAFREFENEGWYRYVKE